VETFPNADFIVVNIMGFPLVGEIGHGKTPHRRRGDKRQQKPRRSQNQE